MKHATFSLLIVLTAVPAAWAIGVAPANDNAALPAPASAVPPAPHWHPSSLMWPASPASVASGISRAALHTGPRKEGASYFEAPSREDDMLDTPGTPLRGDRFHWRQP
ncbi:hypothetical protein [Paraburkholderia lycopersici]|uniref:Uncharacterized protein n=1 Tax=Paraburkholderia lycopersici TaxID=416944 RepID=A0A1G7BQF0_9BURK|nr:hypothetical protein [Paraburkholderia lycopersici]SDE28415.1 hypothetical protein SAMN05421548_14031 [Paraburkholderia lycopersici]